MAATSANAVNFFQLLCCQLLGERFAGSAARRLKDALDDFMSSWPGTWIRQQAAANQILNLLWTIFRRPDLAHSASRGPLSSDYLPDQPRQIDQRNAYSRCSNDCKAIWSNAVCT